jgi:heme exporter protein D
METIGHLPFIVGSYAAAFVVVGALVAWVTLDFRAQRRALADLETRGLTRRSAAARPGRPATMTDSTMTDSTISRAATMSQAKEKA